MWFDISLFSCDNGCFASGRARAPAPLLLVYKELVEWWNLNLTQSFCNQYIYTFERIVNFSESYNMETTSQVRQNFHKDSEDGINRQINKELYASYVYLSIVSNLLFNVILYFIKLFILFYFLYIRLLCEINCNRLQKFCVCVCVCFAKRIRLERCRTYDAI